MRLFIGIGLPDPVGERLANAARRLLPAKGSEGARIRWTLPGNLHVTVSFMGQVEAARLGQIEQKLAALRAARLSLELSGISVFANAGILFAKLKSSEGLLSFAEQVFLAMEGCGIPREQRPYTPHVTLARIRNRAGGRSRTQLRRRPSAGDDPAFWQSFEAAEFRLYESFTRPEGSEYRVLRAFSL